MSYKDTINPDKLIGSTPTFSDAPYVWADFFEINVALTSELVLSNEDLYQSVFRGDDFSPSESDEIRPSKIDKAKTIIRDGLTNIELRTKMLGDKYPFIYDEHRLELGLKDELTNIHYTYLVLLLASNLKYLTKQASGLFTSSFEKISLDVVRTIFPNACVKLFGSSNLESSIRPSEKYLPNKLKDRIKLLAQDICHRHQPEVENLPESNLGDGGLDIVGYINLGDNRGSFPLVFVQCACSKEEWEKKQFSTGRAQWEKWINLNYTSLQNFIMVPFPFVNNNGEWLDTTSITHNVMIDRIRIMNSLPNEMCSVLSTFSLIQTCLSSYEP